ncbi:hypothetical protein RHMOL_Rhmol03G0024200 [Rhododendron molle]|uniref:Uncharacterized protein n=1 Tax=Rhododendron molle TaxID=49168 RepID=A0ACC0PBA7_RHOML|nr:hypothetical protein RHMOL_Rhmol03G0024200 [Rhododendron molle]
MGGRHILISFINKEVRKKIIKEDWWERWFDSIKPWNGEIAGRERFAWLSCTGVPLNADFQKVGGTLLGNIHGN